MVAMMSEDEERENREMTLHLQLVRLAGEGVVSGWRTQSLEEIASSNLPTCVAEAKNLPVAIVWQKSEVSWVVVYQRNEARWFKMRASTNHGRASAQAALQHHARLRDQAEFVSELEALLQDVPSAVEDHLNLAYGALVAQVFVR